MASSLIICLVFCAIILNVYGQNYPPVCEYSGQKLLDEISVDYTDAFFYKERDMLGILINKHHKLEVVNSTTLEHNVIQNVTCTEFIDRTITLETKDKKCTCVQDSSGGVFTPPFSLYTSIDVQSQEWVLEREKLDKCYYWFLAFGTRYKQRCQCLEPFKNEEATYRISTKDSEKEIQIPLTKCVLETHRDVQDIQLPCKFASNKVVMVQGGKAKYFRTFSEVETQNITYPIYIFSFDFNDPKLEERGEMALRLARIFTTKMSGTVLITITAGFNVLPWEDLRCFGFEEGYKLCRKNSQRVTSFWQVGSEKKTTSIGNHSLFVPLPSPTETYGPCNYDLCYNTFAPDFESFFYFLTQSLAHVNTGSKHGSQCPTRKYYKKVLYPLAADMVKWPSDKSWVDLSDPVDSKVRCCKDTNYWFSCERKQIPCPLESTENPISSLMRRPPFHCFEPEPNAIKLVAERYWRYFVNQQKTRHNKLREFKFDLKDDMQI